jgi:hypothetical protein
MNNFEFVDRVFGICQDALIDNEGYAEAFSKICAMVKEESAPTSTNTQSTPHCYDIKCSHNNNGICDGANCGDGMS